MHACRALSAEDAACAAGGEGRAAASSSEIPADWPDEGSGGSTAACTLFRDWFGAAGGAVWRRTSVATAPSTFTQPQRPVQSKNCRGTCWCYREHCGQTRHTNSFSFLRVENGGRAFDRDNERDNLRSMQWALIAPVHECPQRARMDGQTRCQANAHRRQPGAA